jgi:hypothetical protein
MPRFWRTGWCKVDIRSILGYNAFKEGGKAMKYTLRKENRPLGIDCHSNQACFPRSGIPVLLLLLLIQAYAHAVDIKEKHYVDKIPWTNQWSITSDAGPEAYSISFSITTKPSSVSVTEEKIEGKTYFFALKFTEPIASFNKPFHFDILETRYDGNQIPYKTVNHTLDIKLLEFSFVKSKSYDKVLVSYTEKWEVTLKPLLKVKFIWEFSRNGAFQPNKSAVLWTTFTPPATGSTTNETLTVKFTDPDNEEIKLEKQTYVQDPTSTIPLNVSQKNYDPVIESGEVIVRVGSYLLFTVLDQEKRPIEKVMKSTERASEVHPYVTLAGKDLITSVGTTSAQGVQTDHFFARMTKTVFNEVNESGTDRLLFDGERVMAIVISKFSAEVRKDKAEVYFKHVTSTSLGKTQ